MKLKQVWMSPETGRKSHYGYRTVGGILGIVLLMMLLLLVGTFLFQRMKVAQKTASPILVLEVCALGIGLVGAMSRRAMRDATLFFLTEDDRLWVMDARGLPSHGDGFLGFALSSMETQAFLRRQGRQPFLPRGAQEICSVMGIKENSGHYAIRCLMDRGSRRPVRRTCFLIKGIPQEQDLLWQLERRKAWDPEPVENRNPLYILLSGLALAACVSLCVLSHPWVARLPGELYFPCMGASVASFGGLFYFLLRQHRGE